MLTRFKIYLWNKYLPIYWNIPYSRYMLKIYSYTPKWSSVRITIEEDTQWRFTIKEGEYKDIVRCSKYFNPFGIYISKYIK